MVPRLGKAMRRRDFIKVIGGATAVWPMVVRAQQGERMRRIGVLVASAEDESDIQLRLAGFVRKWHVSDPERCPTLVRKSLQSGH